MALMFGALKWCKHLPGALGQVKISNPSLANVIEMEKRFQTLCALVVKGGKAPQEMTLAKLLLGCWQ